MEAFPPDCRDLALWIPLGCIGLMLAALVIGCLLYPPDA